MSTIEYWCTVVLLFSGAGRGTRVARIVVEIDAFPRRFKLTASSTRVRLAGLLARLLESSIERTERGGGVERERGPASCKGLFV
jgi:hypothetical protein